jgi:diacylglycerol kinase
MWRSVTRSFRYAGRGLQLALRSHFNMRVHLALAGLVAVAAAWADVSAMEAAILIVCAMVVLAAELFNTAIEVLVDLHVGEQYHVLAGRAKDLAAAAVLVTALGAAVIGAVVLGPPALRAVAAGYLDRVGAARLVGLVAVCALSAGVAGRQGQMRTARRVASHIAGRKAADAAPDQRSSRGST